MPGKRAFDGDYQCPIKATASGRVEAGAGVATKDFTTKYTENTKTGGAE